MEEAVKIQKEILKVKLTFGEIKPWVLIYWWFWKNAKNWLIFIFEIKSLKSFILSNLILSFWELMIKYLFYEMWYKYLEKFFVKLFYFNSDVF